MSKARYNSYSEFIIKFMFRVSLHLIVLFYLQLAGPISLGETYDRTLLKFNRKEFLDLVATDQERNIPSRLPSGLRHRGSTVAPSTVTPTTVAWEDQQQTYETR